MQADGMCTYCGKPFCNNCIVEIKGKMYCKNDLDKVIDEAKTSAVQQSTTSSNVNTNTNVIGGYVIGFPPKKKLPALLLCFFFGYLGFHRFYVGKTGTGLIWLLTLGLLGVGFIIDFIVILLGGFRDKWGRPLM